MSSTFNESFSKSAAIGIDATQARLDVLDYLSPDIVVPMLIDNQLRQIADDDLTPEEMEWMEEFVQTDSIYAMYETLLNELGMRGMSQALYELDADPNDDLNYYTYLIDEDPERIAAAYATEILDRFL